jgi:hypothetical protein
MQFITGSTPILRKILVSAMNEASVVSGLTKELFALPVVEFPKTECAGITAPATGNIAKPLITFLRFILY